MAKNSHNLTTLKKLSLAATAILGLTIPAAITQAQVSNIITSVTEDINQARNMTIDSGSGCSKLENTTAPVRAGQRAFKHVVDKCGKRSEFAMDYTRIGETYWQAWSMYIPTTWVNSSEWYDIVAQWPAYPTNRSFRNACGAVGSYMVISNENLNFSFQHKGDSADIQCDKYTLGNINDMKGKWVDFVMHSKWTGDTDGFFKLWMKVGDGEYVQAVNYTGRTFWNDEGSGPYFKMGLYKGRANWDGPGAPRTLYTDEYRLGNANSSFAQMALGQNPPPAVEPPPAQPILEDFAVSDSNMAVKLGGGWSINSGKYVLSSTTPGVASGNNTNISVYKTPLSSNFAIAADASATPTASSWDDFSLMFNYQNLQNYYYVGFNENNSVSANGIFKVSGGVVSKLATFSSAIQSGSTYKVEVKKTGDTIKVYRNGVLQGTAQDATFSGGQVGFGSINSPATFDNLKVE